MERRLRRGLVEIERRTLTLRSSLDGRHHTLQVVVDSGPERPDAPCSACGGRWLLVQGSPYPKPAGMQPELLDLLQSLNLHVQTGSSGEIWICQRSLEQIGANP